MAESLEEIQVKIVEYEAKLKEEKDTDERKLLLQLLVQLRENKNLLLRQQTGRSVGAAAASAGEAKNSKMLRRIYRSMKAMQKDLVFLSYPISASEHSSQYRPAAISAYQVNGDPEGQLRCLVTDQCYPADCVKAAHIFQRKWKQAALVNANIDVDGLDNVVLMHRSVEKMFDQLRFCIIPVTQVDFRIKILDTKLLAADKERFVTGSPTLTWQQLDGRPLQFRTDTRPSALCLAVHARRAVMQAEANNWIAKGSVKVVAEHMAVNPLMHKFFAGLLAASSPESSSGSGSPEETPQSQQEASEAAGESLSATASQEL